VGRAELLQFAYDTVEARGALPDHVRTAVLRLVVSDADLFRLLGHLLDTVPEGNVADIVWAVSVALVATETGFERAFNSGFSNQERSYSVDTSIRDISPTARIPTTAPHQRSVNALERLVKAAPRTVRGA
jgi:hypothetical protein